MILEKLALMRLISTALIIIGVLAFPTQAWADAEIVIAIRYLQAERTEIGT